MPLLLRNLFTVFIFYTSTAYCLMFTSQDFIAVVNNSTQPGSHIQQLTAIPTKSYNKITYSIQPNEYITVTEDGAVIWKEAVLNTDGEQRFEVEASEDNGKAVTAQLSLSNSLTCPDLDESLELNIPENINRSLPILFIGHSCGSTPSLSGDDEYFEIVDQVLHVRSLDYNKEETINTSLLYNEKTTDIKVNVADEVDKSPSFSPREQVVFRQRNYTIDADQYTQPKDINLVVFFDSAGNPENWRIKYMNNEINGQPVLKASLSKQRGHMVFYSVQFPKTWVAKSSMDIDVVMEDGNIDEQMSINNQVTFRFSFTYIDVDELYSLNLTEQYNTSLSIHAPQYTQVQTIDHSYGKSLRFSLAYYGDGLSLSSCERFLDVTQHQGIVYVSDARALSSCDYDGTLLYQLTVSVIGHNRTSLINVRLNNVSLLNNSSPGTSCATHNSSESCSSTSGVGSLSCQWKFVEAGEFNYSTCVAGSDCGDGTCSELEGRSDRICPQDCLSSIKWAGQTKPFCNKEERGLCEASGVCYCQDSDCQCRPESELGIIYKDVDDKEMLMFNNSLFHIPREVRTPSDDVCGVGCIIGIAVAGGVLIIVMAVLSLWLRNQTVNRHKKVGNINAWRVNGDNPAMRLPEFTQSPLYPDASTPSTVMSVISDWSSMPPFYPIYASTELYDEKWELSRENLIIGDYIGEGEFGRVNKAQYKKAASDDWSPAAVKMLKDGASRAEFADLLSEYTLLKEVDHPNVIKLLGAATLNGPFHLVVEYCEHGSLKSHLRNVRTQEPIYMNGATQFYTAHAEELMGYSWQISKGMQYLSDMKLVHRDLATRNILIAANNVIKISDFGMTKDIYEEEAYKKKGQGRIPVKWMAPESLYHQIYTTKSDVWSFGIVLWEIATLGATPYPGIPAERMYHLLQEGYRMDRPETCSIALYNLMKKCWEFDPLNRPSFKDIKHNLEQMLEDQDDYLDLSVAQAQRLCHGSTSISTASEEDSSLGDSNNQLTIALLHDSREPKVVEDYMRPNDDRSYSERRPLRYTTLEFTEDE